jgi:O-antigen/teichoic acid export membrane protein
MERASSTRTPAGVDRPTFDRFARRSLETFLGYGAATAGNALLFLLVARALGSAGTGVVSASIALATVLMLVVFGLLHLPNTYLGVKEPDALGALLANSLFVAAVFGTTVAAAVFGFLVAIDVTFGAERYELAVVLASVPFAAASRLVTTLVLARGRSLAFNVLYALRPALSLAAVVTAFLVVGATASAALIAFSLAQGILLVVSLAAAGIRIAAPSRRLLGESLRYALKAYAGSTLQLVNFRLDLFLVSAIRGASAAGIYSVAVVLAELLWRISTAAGTILMPRVATTEAAPVEFTLRVSRTVAFLVSLSAIAVSVASALVVLPLLGDDFERALTPLVLLLPGAVALGIMDVLTSDLAGRGRPQYLSYAAALGLAVTLAVNPILIPLWGASGAAVASTLSYTASTLLVAAVFVRRFGVRPSELVLLRRADVPLRGRTTAT